MSGFIWLRPVRGWLGASPRARPRRLDVGAAQRQGDRAEQQDRLGIFRLPGDERLLLVAADGLGGLSNGGAAAALAVAAFGRAWQAPPASQEEARCWLEAACLAAHASVFRFNHDSGAAGGSTIAAACVTTRWAVWCHVGDTRLYLMRGGRLVRRTHDHSLAELLGTAGAGGRAADRNTLTQCLGGAAMPKPALDGSELAVGDGLILASDGVWGQLPEATLLQSFAGRDLAVAAGALTDRAVTVAAGRSDNASALILRIGTAAR